MPKIESEKIDCLYRPYSRPAPRGKIESVRTHSEVIEQFASFSMLKLLFLVRNWHCWSRKAFPRQMTPQSREKTAKTAVFRHRWQAWKVVRSIAAVRQRPRTPRNWRCSFAFFETFLWHFNKKQRAEVIFRLSRPVSCKNQENGSGKRWSLHAPLNRKRKLWKWKQRNGPFYVQLCTENQFNQAILIAFYTNFALNFFTRFSPEDPFAKQESSLESSWKAKLWKSDFLVVSCRSRRKSETHTDRFSSGSKSFRKRDQNAFTWKSERVLVKRSGRTLW